MSVEHKEGGIGVLDKQREELKEPPKWRVLIHNDDYTPMDFVVAVLTGVFLHEEMAAIRIMLDVHKKGVGTAGVYTKEIAETKMMKAKALIDAHDHPLEVSMEPAE